MATSNEPIISIIIPVYNIGDYLPQCLDSLLAQTLPQIEILCVDDASGDHSLAVIRQYQARDSRIRLLQQEHQGVSAARNLGIRHARGQYIAFIDGDDWTEPDMLEKMLQQAEKTGCDMVVCSACVHFLRKGIRGCRSRKSLQRALTVGDGVRTADPKNRWELISQPGVWPFVWNKLIRRDLICRNRLAFSPELPLGEDGVFLQLLLQYTETIAFLPDQLYHYRYQRRNSATVRHFQDPATRFRQHIQVCRVMLQDFSGRNLLDRNGTELLQWILRFLYSDFVGLPAANKQEAAQALNTLFQEFRLTGFSGELSALEGKRLAKLMRTDIEYSDTTRLLEIVRTKAENRITRLWNARK